MFKIFELRAMMVGAFITPSSVWDLIPGRVSGPLPLSQTGDVVPNLPALAGTLAIHGGEVVRGGQTNTLQTL